MKKDDPRKHHFCPQFYLSNFTKTESSTGRLYVFDKTNYQSLLGKPKNVAHQRDFYKVKVKDGDDPFILEREFSKIEAGAKRAIDFIKTTNSIPEGEDGNYLLNFVGLLAVRTPSHRNNMDSFHQDILNRVLDITLQNKERWDGLVARVRSEGKELPETTYEKVKELFDKGEFIFQVDQSWLLYLMLTSATTIINLLGHRNWSLAVADEGHFVCSDNPVSLSWIKHVPGPYSPGFAMKNTQVTLPLTNKIALLGVLETGYGSLHHFEKDRVAALNNFTIKSAERFIYSIEDDFEWLQENLEIGQKDDFEQMLRKMRSK